MLNTYQRPLFRQAGGPAGLAALPPPPPAGVAAIPQQDPRAMVEAAGQTASSEMESVGQDYVTEMMQSLDTAENFKTVIDALRGNELPIDQRFAELAEYVGEDDAEKTPESVLTMVQPVIMMTEEGNVDSGIGQLMQSLTGEVDMMTEEGGLTDMGQGVGSLMVANQAPPPPQRFADGGAVQQFANGGSPFAFRPGASYMNPAFAGTMQGFTPQTAYDPKALQLGYEQRLPMYMGILDPEKERAMTKSQIMFDISQAGLNLASGVDPRTGQSMTNQSFASQVAAAAGGLPQQIGARAAMSRQSEQAAKLAALQGAEAETTATRAAVARERAAVTTGSFGMALQSQDIEARFERDRLLFQDEVEGIGVRAAAAKDVFAANTEIDHGFTLIRQTQSENFEGGHRDADREQIKWVAEQNFEREDKALELQRDAQTLREDMFKDAQERGLSTGGFFDWGMSDARHDAYDRVDYTRRLEALTLEAHQIDNDGVGLAQSLNQYVQLAELSLRNRAQTLNETNFAYGVMVDQMMPAASAEFSTDEMHALLSDGDVIRAYASGAPMPKVEYALSQRYQVRYDPETGLQSSADLPPGWDAAFQQRHNLGVATPNIGSQSQQSWYDARTPDQQWWPSNPGRAEGGEVKKMQGGGDPRGLYEPTTGTYLPRPVSDEPLPIEEPLITATGQGIDITSATGSDAWLMNKANTAFEAVSGILGGPGVVIGEEYQEAMRALDSFNQIALTRALGSIAGRENRELQERLARLEVPAGEFLYGDRKALAQFQTSSRVMDFAIREQEAALRGPRLTRTERNKARKDLAALQGIQLEYDRLADAYTRKIEGDTADVSSRLDEFFN